MNKREQPSLDPNELTVPRKFVGDIDDSPQHLDSFKSNPNIVHGSDLNNEKNDKGHRTTNNSNEGKAIDEKLDLEKVMEDLNIVDIGATADEKS